MKLDEFAFFELEDMRADLIQDLYREVQSSYPAKITPPIVAMMGKLNHINSEIMKRVLLTNGVEFK